MKPFLKTFIPATILATCLFTLSACETVEGIKNDIADIDFSLDNFTTASSTEEEEHAEFLIDGNCPDVQIVQDLSRIYDFKNAQPSNLASSAIMEEVQSTCAYGDRSVTVDLKLAINGSTGSNTPQDKTFFSYPFFVAVTSDSGKILAKEIFAASMNYDAGQTAQTYHETLRQIIPADDRIQGSRYKVMVGFQLTEKQLAYNRQRMEEERLAAEQAEKARIAAQKAAEEKAAAEKAKMDAQNEAIAIKSDMLKDTDKVSAPIAAPAVKAPSPYDMFKTDEN